MQGFGAREVGAVLKERVGDYEISVIAKEHMTQYRRSLNNKEVVKLAIAGRALTYSISPRPPGRGRLRSVTHLMVRLPYPLLVGPMDSVRIEYAVPSDIEVKVGDYAVDWFPLHGIKYALYGSPERGHLCRFLRAEELAGSGQEYFMRFTLQVTNSFDEPIKVTKFVVPINAVSTYVDASGKAYSDTILMNVIDRRRAVVRTAVAVKYYNKKLILVAKRAVKTFVMLYGY